jgi:predicted branched-subunit amino acid permease
MSPDLDDWFAQLAAAPTDHGLDRLEAALGRDIAARRREARTVKAMAPIRVAAFGLALAVGVSAGGAAGLATLQTGPSAGAFAAATQFAPSTLLDGEG